MRRSFEFYFFQILGIFCSFIRILLKTAWPAIVLGSLCRDRFGVYFHPSFGRAACRVQCVTRARALRNAILFLNKNQAAGRNTA